MDTRPFLVVSDIHLGVVPRSTEDAFRDFLAYAREIASGLLINGDLFDFWFEYRTVIPRRHFRVLAQLAELADAGVELFHVGGNHDAWGGSFLRDEVGIRLLDGPVEMELAGRRTLIAHGDGLGTGDLGYRVLRRVIRSRWATGTFRWLHPDLGSRVAHLASSTEDRLNGDDERTRDRARFLREWAVDRLRERSELDLVLAGHVHSPVIVEHEPGRYYVNTGDWLSHFTYLVLSDKNRVPELKRWAGET